MITFWGISPQDLGLRVKSTMPNRKSYSVFCPFGVEKGAHAEYNPKDDYYYCYSCGKRASAKDIVEYTGGKIIYKQLYMEEKENQSNYREYNKLPLAYNNEYLINRGLGDNAIIERFQIRSDYNAVYIPFYDYDGELVAYQARQYKLMPKYLYHGTHLELYNLNNLKQYRGQDIYIVEGVFGVINAWKYGFENVFALTGVSKLNGYKVKDLLNSYKIRLLLDADEPAYKSAIKYCKDRTDALCAFAEADEINWKDNLPEFKKIGDIGCLQVYLKDSNTARLKNP